MSYFDASIITFRIRIQDHLNLRLKIYVLEMSTQLIRNKIRYLSLIAPGLLFALPCLSSAAVLVTSLSRSEFSVGDRIVYTVSVMVPQNTAVVPPDPSEFGSVTVKEWGSKKYPLNKADSIAFTYQITTYTPENCTIPALRFIIEAGSSRDTLATEPLPLTVVPLITSDSADLVDLKPPQVTGKRPLVWLWLGLAALAVATAVFFSRRYFRRSKLEPPSPPPLPPYEEAMLALNALSAKQHLLKGLIREYVFELSDILKRYIERRFSVNAAEFTTEEMLAWLGISPLEKTLRSSMDWFFRATDPVKFAKFLPDSDTIARYDTEVRAFLTATRPAPETTAGTTATGAAV